MTIVKSLPRIKHVMGFYWFSEVTQYTALSAILWMPMDFTAKQLLLASSNGTVTSDVRDATPKFKLVDENCKYKLNVVLHVV